MRFTPRGLIFGAGTILLSRRAMGEEVLEAAETRLTALLTAAHLFRPSTTGLAHLRKASRCWAGGDGLLAQVHLALSRLDRLTEPGSDARRLFLAEALLDCGLPEASLLRALGFEEGGAKPIAKQ
jgi:hypothetical protein